jgi:hypothetical protein
VIVELADEDSRARDAWIGGVVHNGGSIADAMMEALLLRMTGDVQQDKAYTDKTTMVRRSSHASPLPQQYPCSPSPPSFPLTGPPVASTSIVCGVLICFPGPAEQMLNIVFCYLGGVIVLVIFPMAIAVSVHRGPLAA